MLLLVYWCYYRCIDLTTGVLMLLPVYWSYYWCTDVITGVLILLLVYWCYYWCNSFSLKLLYLKSDFTLTMVYLNPALNKTAPKIKLLLCFLTISHVLKQSISFMKLFNRSYTDSYQPGKIWSTILSFTTWQANPWFNSESLVIKISCW